MRTYYYSPCGQVDVLFDNYATGQRKLYALEKRLDLRNHSPNGFSCGYCGSGPSQLALAILADCLNDDEHALRLYQRFKAKVIALLPREKAWSITAHQVMAVVLELETEMTEVAASRSDG